MRKNMRNLMRRVISLGLVLVMCCVPLSGCGSKKDDTIKITIFSQTANYAGEQTGWSAKILKDKFNVVVNIVKDDDGVFETRMESGNLGDIVIFGSDGDDYTSAVKKGLLYDWNEDGLLEEYGPYIYENMQAALAKNAKLSESLTGEKTVYGFGYNVAQADESGNAHEAFFYTWDIRWDLYKQLGYPEYKNMDDMISVFKAMKEICPTDDNGNETYAVSIWPDWDGDMVMYVKAFATAYWGYDEAALGLYDPSTGTYYPALQAGGPYLTALKFFNQLYQNKLLDPNSMTQTYDNAYEKVQAGGTFFSIFNYSGYLGYNTDEHTNAGKMMTSLVADEASPIVYGMTPSGGNRIWAIGSNTQYPEKCMEIINWLSTPEGVLTYNYGPQGVTWDYDDEGYTYITEFGIQALAKKDVPMIGEFEGTGTYKAGEFQHNQNTWSINAKNPESAGNEVYNKEMWKSYAVGTSSDIYKDWSAKVGYGTTQEYMENHAYKVSPASDFVQASKSGEFKTTWEAVTEVVREYSWQAIYAKDDAEFDRIVGQMTYLANQYGYNSCITWGLEQANIRYQAELDAKAE